MKCSRHVRRTTGITGTKTATAKSLRHKAGNMPTPGSRGRMISIGTAIGCRSQATAGAGHRTLLQRIETPILTDDGFGSLTGVGRGFPTSPGGGRLITTDAGLSQPELGCGGQDRLRPRIVPYTRPPMFLSWASGSGSATGPSVLVSVTSVWAGCLSVRPTTVIPGGDNAPPIAS